MPQAAGTSGKEFRTAFTQHWLPALERFQPQLLLISAGFDAHRDDDLAMLKHTETDYARVWEGLNPDFPLALYMRLLNRLNLRDKNQKMFVNVE